MTPFVDVYKANNQSDGSIDKLKFIIVVIGDFQSKEIIGYTWYLTESTRTLKYFLADDSKQE